MHRTEGLNHLANLFQDGPPGTRIEEDWLNAIQEEIAYVITQAGVTLKTAATETRQQLKEALDILYFNATGSKVFRSQFSYNGDVTPYTVRVKGGAYRVKDKLARWTAELATNAIAAPVGLTRYYLYLDYSAIVSGVAITATELIWSITVPTYSSTYGGWYNGDDLCIFGVITDAAPTNIAFFLHDGGECVFSEYAHLAALGIKPSSTWTDVDLGIDFMPGFATRANITVQTTYADTATYVNARPNGGNHSHRMGFADADVDYSYLVSDIMTDSSQVMEIEFNNITVNNSLSIFINGWYFPIGM